MMPLYHESRSDSTVKSGSHSATEFRNKKAQLIQAPARVSYMVSRPAGFHRQPLAEPDMRLSLHPAPIKHDAFAYRIASARRARLVLGSIFRERAKSGPYAP